MRKLKFAFIASRAVGKGLFVVVETASGDQREHARLFFRGEVKVHIFVI